MLITKIQMIISVQLIEFAVISRFGIQSFVFINVKLMVIIESKYFSS